MRRTIIGILGLANKPKADLLAQWWEASILNEQFSFYDDGVGTGSSTPKTPYGISYWTRINPKCEGAEHIISQSL